MWRHLFAIALAVVAEAAGASNGRPRAPVIDILSYNDVYELTPDMVDGMELGGPSRVIPIVKAMRQRNPQHSLVLFAGDTMSPSLWSFHFKGLQMVAAHNALGVDFACLGNHEFDFDLEAFANVSRASKFTWLNANCYESATDTLLRGTQPRAVKQLGNLKVGLFGVMYDLDTPNKGVYWTDPVAAAMAQVQILREVERVDIVIALTHQLMVHDDRLAQRVPGIDIIYGGHEHNSILSAEAGTPYLKAAMNFRSVWRSQLQFYPAVADRNLPAVVRAKHELIPITHDLPSDPTFDAVIADFSHQLTNLQCRVIGSLCEPIDLRKPLVQTRDMPVAHVFADAAISFYDDVTPDVALINAGIIRSDREWPAVSITLGDLISWSPFGNKLVVFWTDGASLKKFIGRTMVDNCGDGHVRRNGVYMHPAGIKYAFVCTGTDVGELTAVEWSNHVTRRGVVEDDEKLQLMVTDYLFDNHFTLLPAVRIGEMIIDNTKAGRIDSALEKYIQKQPNATLCPTTEERSIVVVLE